MTPYRTYDLVPDLKLPDENGDPHALRSHHGRNLVLVLYESIREMPSKQALSSLHERLNAFRDEHSEIVVVSTDPVEVNDRYRRREVLPFTFLSDPDARLARLIDAFDQHDHRVMRTTLIVDRDGRMAGRIQDEDALVHPLRALRYVQELGATEEWTAIAIVPT